MKKNKVLTTCLAFILSLSYSAYAQNWLWAKSIGYAYTEYGGKVATDQSGNVYLAGNFRSPTLVLDNFTLTNAGGNSGGSDVFLVKYAPDGTVLWATSFAGISNDYVSGVAVDTIGNVYVTGYFNSVSLNIGNSTLQNVGGFDICLAKYNSFGVALWAKSAGGVDGDLSRGICTDVSGNIYLTGEFKSPTINFGTTVTLNNTVSNSFTSDMYIVKYDANGTIMWAKAGGGISFEFGKSISCDASGNVYVSGNFQSANAIFDSVTLIGSGSIDIFILKYSSNGALLWSTSSGGDGQDESSSIAIDLSGNLFLTGYFKSSTISFGNITLDNTINPGTNSRVYLVKFDPSGIVQWATAAGGDSFDRGTDIATDFSGNIYLIGDFQSPTISFDTNTLYSNGDYEVFFVKYSPSGSVLWSSSIGGGSTEIGRSIATDLYGNIFITGDFSSANLNFNTISVALNPSINGDSDIFLAKYGIEIITQLEEQLKQQKLTIYPNPANSIINIGGANTQNLEIQNTLGEIVFYKQNCNSLETVDVSGIAKGVYFVRLNEQTLKMVKE